MGENQSKPISNNNSSQKPLLGGLFSKQGSQRSPQYPTSHSLASNQSPDQQEQLSQDEVRKMRLARMEKQDYVPDRGAPKDIKSHPVSIEFGSNAYIIHINLEDLYQNTFHPTSLSRNPRLRLLQPAEKSDEIRLFTLDNMDEVIMKLLKSETYYPGGERLVFLSDLYGRLTAKDQEGLLAAEKLQGLREKIFSYLLDYLLNPSAPEDPRNIKDCSCSVYDALYTKFTSIDTDEFLHSFMNNLPGKHYDMILTPIFKRMIRDCSDTNISGRYNIQKATVLLQNLLQIAPKIAVFFFNHELFIPKSSNPTGLDYQKNTVFGAFLSFTIINNDSPSMQEYLETPGVLGSLPASMEAIRDKLHEPINAFHRLIEAIIKLDPTKYKRYILDWISGVLISNQAMQNQGETKLQHKFATHGWFCNFLVLLLKLCQKMLDDPSKYPTWLTKIELNYLFDKPLFEGESLLNGKSVPKKDFLDDSESKYSFLTELIFLTSNAWLLMRNVIQGFNLAVYQAQITYVSLTPEKLKDVRNLSSTEIEGLKPSHAYQFQLADPYLTKQLHKLLNFSALLILHSYDVKVQDLNDIPNLFEQLLKNEQAQSDKRGGLPTYWLHNLARYLEVYTTNDRKNFFENFGNLDIVMNLLLTRLIKQDWASLPFQKKLSLGVFCKLLPLSDTLIQDGHLDLAYLFKNNPFLEKHITDALIGLFIETQLLNQENKRYERNLTRCGSFSVLNYIMGTVFAQDPKSSYVIQSLHGLFNNSAERYFEFMDTFMDDLVFLVDDLFSRIQERQVNPRAALNRGSRYQTLHGRFVEIILGNTDVTDNISSLVATLKEYCLFAVNVSKGCPEFFLNDLVRERFITSLNYCVRVFNSQESHVRIMEGTSQESTEESLLASLVRVYLNLYHRDEFIVGVKADEKNYKPEYFYQTQIRFEASGALNGFEKENLAEFLAYLN